MSEINKYLITNTFFKHKNSIKYLKTLIELKIFLNSSIYIQNPLKIY